MTSDEIEKEIDTILDEICVGELLEIPGVYEIVYAYLKNDLITNN